MEGPLSPGPTTSSLYSYAHHLSYANLNSHVAFVGAMLFQLTSRDISEVLKAGSRDTAAPTFYFRFVTKFMKKNLFVLLPL